MPRGLELGRAAALELQRRRALGLQRRRRLGVDRARPPASALLVASIVMLVPLSLMSPVSVIRIDACPDFSSIDLSLGDDLDLVRAEVELRSVGEGDLEVLVRRLLAAAEGERGAGRGPQSPLDDLVLGEERAPTRSAASPCGPHRPPSTNGRRRSPCSNPTRTSSSICGMIISPESLPAAGRDDPRPPALLAVAQRRELHPHPAQAVGILVVGDDADGQPDRPNPSTRLGRRRRAGRRSTTARHRPS